MSIEQLGSRLVVGHPQKELYICSFIRITFNKHYFAHSKELVKILKVIEFLTLVSDIIFGSALSSTESYINLKPFRPVEADDLVQFHKVIICGSSNRQFWTHQMEL